jgi:xanthine dehydrogenase YagR molybdenum-binding subunit
MKFNVPAGANPIDQLTIVGQPARRIEGPLKTTGTATYAYEWQEPVRNAAYGEIVGAAIAKGTIRSMDLSAAKAAPGVLAIVTAENAGKLEKGGRNTAKLLGGPVIDHYHQAIAVVVADTFEQARAAAALVKVECEPMVPTICLAPRTPAKRQPYSVVLPTRPSVTLPQHLQPRLSNLNRPTPRRTRATQ